MTANQSAALLDDAVDHETDGGDALLSFSLSFRDIAVVVGSSGIHRAVSSPSDSSFEFFSSAGDRMCLAEDVFLGGKLLPDPMPRPPLPPWRLPSDHRQQSESRTMEKQRMARRAASVPSRKDLRPPAAAAAVRLQPKWYLFVLGPMRIPAEMEMGDMRSRQRKRTMPPAPVPATANAADGPSSRKSATWRFIRSLSCNEVEIAPVEPRPVRFTSHAAV